jgi:Baculovirus U-box/Ring-like domain
MLVTVNVQDKSAYLYRMFKEVWTKCAVECQICFDRIGDDGLVAVTDYKTLNVEKMFHEACLRRWQRERSRDPFNRNVKFYFNFPPKNEGECKSLLAQMTGFIGDDQADKRYSNEYTRVSADDMPMIDVELDLLSLLRYK